MRKFILGICLVLLAACVPAAAGTPLPALPTAASRPGGTKTIPVPAGPTSTPTPLPAAVNPIYVQGSTQKVCQLLGENDWATGQPTAARTFTNFGLDAADLGYPVEHQGKLILLFGDSWPPPHPAHETVAQSEVPPDDSVGLTARTAPPNREDGKCLELQINHDAAKKFTPATVTGPVKVKQGFFNVPSGGVSVGGALFAFFWTDHCTSPNPVDPAQVNPLTRPPATGKCPETDDRNSLGRSVLAQSGDDGRTFNHVVPMPAGFVYTTAVDTALQDDLPTEQRLGVFIFGSPRYRASIPYLAYAPADTFADPATWRFFTGLDAAGQPKWVTDSTWLGGSASPALWNPPGAPELFSTPTDAGRCVGELSVTWNSVLGKWLMMYACRQEVVVRIAPAPWGPWSEPTAVLPLASPADRAPWECTLVMSPTGCGSRRDFWGKDKNGKLTAGAFYAPYVLNRYTTAVSGGSGLKTATIYWVVSTWNPYEVTVMQSTIEVPPSAVP